MQVLDPALAIRTSGTQRFVNRHSIEDRLCYVKFGHRVCLHFNERFFTEDVIARQNGPLDSAQSVAAHMCLYVDFALIYQPIGEVYHSKTVKTSVLTL